VAGSLHPKTKSHHMVDGLHPFEERWDKRAGRSKTRTVIAIFPEILLFGRPSMFAVETDAVAIAQVCAKNRIVRLPT
jgi:hypothetical protein